MIDHELRAQISKAAGNTKMDRVLADAVWSLVQQDKSLIEVQEVANSAGDTLGLDPEILRRGIIALFKALEDKGIGKFFVGRKGHESRFEFYKMKEQKSEGTGSPSGNRSSAEMVPYTFPLREGVTVRFSLPLDFRHTEAERLSTFIKSLPLK